MDENQHATIKHILLVEKQKCIDSLPQKSLSRDSCCRTKHRVTEIPRGGTLGISGWGYAAGTLEPLAYTRASLAKFCYPILQLIPQITPNLD